ncbi:MAG: PKD domain-containing protein [Chitinophagaceae bacterium]|nr:PKD domain-containing protein [Chitinophagaceae bacterium]
MRSNIFLFLLFAATIFQMGCKKDGIDSDTSFIKSAQVKTTDKIFDITNDNSGKVTITPLAEGASSFVINFGDGTGGSSSAEVDPGHSAVHFYPEGKYTVTITSNSISGQAVTNTYPLEITYRAPENLDITTNISMHTLKVKATALYAASYLMYFGDVANETGTPLSTGAELTHTYATAGNYNLKVVALSGGVATTQKTVQVTAVDPFGLPITFDQPFINYFFGTFGDNQQFTIVDNPNKSGLNTSDKVGKFVRGNQGWSGTYSPLNNRIDMSQGKIIRVYVYNPDPASIGKKLNVELESGSSLSNGVAVLKVPVTTSGVWEELVFDYSTIAAIPSTETFGQLVLRFDDVEDGAGAVIYVDNFRQTN